MSVKTKIIQSSASMRWELFEEISKQLDFYLSDKNIQCFNSCGDLNRFKGKKKRKELFKGYKGKEEICLRDFFYNLKHQGQKNLRLCVKFYQFYFDYLNFLYN